ncbi:MAG: hypothetical protein JJ869_03595 [Marivita sp.]|nr:hypothetical protein [Marivita sp.]
MSVSFYVHGHAARHGPRHPVWRQPSASELCHADSHALPAEVVGHACDSGCNDLGVLMDVAANLVLAAINLAAEDGALQQYVFEAKAKPLLALGIGWLWQLKLGMLYPECPF